MLDRQQSLLMARVLWSDLPNSLICVAWKQSLVKCAIYHSRGHAICIMQYVMMWDRLHSSHGFNLSHVALLLADLLGVSLFSIDIVAVYFVPYCAIYFPVMKINNLFYCTVRIYSIKVSLLVCVLWGLNVAFYHIFQVELLINIHFKCNLLEIKSKKNIIAATSFSFA